MAMYYPGSSEINTDTLQTLYLMNPNYLSDTPNHPHPSTPFFNPAMTLPQQFMDVIQLAPNDPSHPSPSQENTIPARFHHNLWGLVDHHHNHHPFSYGISNQPNTPQRGQQQQEQEEQTPKGLSLSLTPGFDKPVYNNPTSDDRDFGGSMNSPEINDKSSSVQSAIMGSEYLKAVRELLDEMVSVGKEASRDKEKMIVKESIRTKVDDEEYGNKNGGDELTTPQRLEIQMKRAKLSSMLDEVEQRCKKYHHQMQTMVTSFDQVAGAGSAKSYTHLALKTILKHFRCLRNTVSSNIKALSKTLGEDTSKLRFVDHRFRQQRTLQQIGMMGNNSSGSSSNNNNNVAWRQQRGLPERAVSVLRAWLFEHFLHPYPKESDKHMLAKQTGLTRSQVSNWFINARVRLWKPMVEEMYMEEVKNPEISPDDNIGRSMQNNEPTLNLVRSPSRISASTIINENPSDKNPKKRRSENHDSSPVSSILSVPDHTETKPEEYHTNNNNNVTFISTNREHTNYLSSLGFGNTSYGILSNNAADDGCQQIPSGFQGNNNNNNRNNFSLTLALPPSETYSQGDFLSLRSFEFGSRIEPVDSNNRPNLGNYSDQILDFQNRQPFSAQLFPDHHHFVA